MKRDLLFIKDFRPIHGYDGEIRNLAEDDLSEISVKRGYISLLLHKRNSFIRKEYLKLYT